MTSLTPIRSTSTNPVNPANIPPNPPQNRVNTLAHSTLAQTNAHANDFDAEGQNRLHREACAGNTGVLLQLVNQQNDLIESKDKKFGCTPLFWAACSGHLSTCNALIKAGANPESTNKDGDNVLHIIANAGNAATAELFAKNVRLRDARASNSCTPLLVAAENGHRAVCEALIKAGANIETTDKHGNNALHLVALKGKTELLPAFENNGRLRNAMNNKKETPLVIAYAYGHHSVYELLIKGGIFPNDSSLLKMADSMGNTPLHTAAKNGHHTICETLISAGINTKAKNGNRQNALHIAAMHGKPEVIELLASDIQLREKKDLNGHTPLLLAIAHGQRSAFLALLRTGADIEATNSFYENALHLSAIVGFKETTELFADKTYLLDSTDRNGDTPLLLAAYYGHLETCRALIKAGADLETTTVGGDNVLHLAASKGHLAIVTLFATHKKLLNSKNNNAHTPLHVASQNGQHVICEALIKAGASVETGQIIKSSAKPSQSEVGDFLSGIVTEIVGVMNSICEGDPNESESPLLLAARNGHRAICETLIKAGANTKAVNPEEGNALHLAAEHGKKDVVLLLITYKILIEMKNKKGETPLLSAVSKGHKEICEILLKAGAHMSVKNYLGEDIFEIANKCKNEKIKGQIVALLKEHREIITALKDIDASNISTLFQAAANGNRKVFEALIKSGVNLEAIDVNGDNILHVAASHGKTEVVELLTHNKNLLEAKGSSLGCTPLLFAAGHGHRATCETLVKAGADIKATNSSGYNILHYAATHNRSEILKLFVGDSILRESKEKNSGYTPLLVAAKMGQTLCCEIIVKAGANVHATDNNGYNVLHLAAQNGTSELVKMFVNDKALLEAKSNAATVNATPLMIAAANGHKAICELLINSGAKVETTNIQGHNSLHIAASLAKLEVVQLLAQNNLLRESKSENEQATPIYFAICNGHRASCEALIKAGANIEVTTSLGNLVHIAAWNGKQEVIPLFASKPHLLDAKRKDGCTPFILAAARGHQSTCEALLKCHINLTAFTEIGNNALHAAVKNGKIEVVRFLITHKQLIEVRNADGETPLHIAVSKGFCEICELLLKADANVLAINKMGEGVVELANKSGDKKDAITKLLNEYHPLTLGFSYKNDIPDQLRKLQYSYDKMWREWQRMNQYLQINNEYLESVFESGKEGEKVLAEKKIIYKHPATKTYYDLLSHRLHGSWHACESIYSGFVTNGQNNFVDTCASAIEKLGGIFPFPAGPIAGIISAVIHTCTSREKAKGIERIALFFNIESGTNQILYIARQLTLLQKEVIIKLDSQHSDQSAFKDLKSMISGDIGPIAQKAIEDCKKILKAITDGKEDILEAILGKQVKIELSSKASTLPSIITSSTAASAPVSPKSKINQGMNPLVLLANFLGCSSSGSADPRIITTIPLNPSKSSGNSKANH